MELNKVEDLLNEIDNFVKKNTGTIRLKLWFRGHSDISWELKPGVYRNSFPKNNEEKRLEFEQSLAQDFRVFSSGLRVGNEDDAQLYFLQQHFGMPTRLLDWSNNPLAALFFAAISNEDKDGELFLMDATKIAPLTAGKKFAGHNFSGIATGTNPVFLKALKTIYEWKTVRDFPDFIIPVRPDYFNKRISLQSSCFTFHVPNAQEVNQLNNTSLTSFKIPRNSKHSIIKELSLLGIDHFNIFGDLASLATTLKMNYKIK